MPGHVDLLMGRGVRAKQNISSAWASKSFNPVFFRHILENRIEDFRTQILCPSSKFSPQTLNNFSLKPKETELKPEPKEPHSQILSGRSWQGWWVAGRKSVMSFTFFVLIFLRKSLNRENLENWQKKAHSNFWCHFRVFPFSICSLCIFLIAQQYSIKERSRGVISCSG